MNEVHNLPIDSCDDCGGNGQNALPTGGCNGAVDNGGCGVGRYIDWYMYAGSHSAAACIGIGGADDGAVMLGGGGRVGSTVISFCVVFFFFICPQTFFHRIAFGKKNVESKMKRENENYISELNMLKVARSSARVSNEKIFIHSLRFEYWLISIGYEVDANAENIMNIVDMQYTTNEK